MMQDPKEWWKQRHIPWGRGLLGSGSGISDRDMEMAQQHAPNGYGGGADALRMEQLPPEVLALLLGQANEAGNIPPMEARHYDAASSEAGDDAHIYERIQRIRGLATQGRGEGDWGRGYEEDALAALRWGGPESFRERSEIGPMQPHRFAALIAGLLGRR